MGERDAIRRIHIERLCFGVRRFACRRIADVPDPHASPQIKHVPGVEDISDQSCRFPQEQASIFVGRDSGGILSSVL